MEIGGIVETRHWENSVRRRGYNLVIGRNIEGEQAQAGSVLCFLLVKEVACMPAREVAHAKMAHEFGTRPW